MKSSMHEEKEAEKTARQSISIFLKQGALAKILSDFSSTNAFPCR